MRSASTSSGYLQEENIGAVSRDNFAIFFRRRDRPFEPAVHWIFSAEIDATYDELRSLGARIVEPLEKKPWGLRQFTVEDLDGNLTMTPPWTDLARLSAELALRMRPDFWYVRERVLPRLESRR